MLGAFVHGRWRRRARVGGIIVTIGGIIFPVIAEVCEHGADEMFEDVPVGEEGSIFLNQEMLATRTGISQS